MTSLLTVLFQNLKKRHGFNNGYKRSDSLDGDLTKAGQHFNVSEYHELLEKAKKLQHNYDKLPPNPSPNPKATLNPNPNSNGNPDSKSGNEKEKQKLNKSGEQDQKFTEFLSSLTQKPSVSFKPSASQKPENPASYAH